MDQINGTANYLVLGADFAKERVIGTVKHKNHTIVTLEDVNGTSKTMFISEAQAKANDANWSALVNHVVNLPTRTTVEGKTSYKDAEGKVQTDSVSGTFAQPFVRRDLGMSTKSELQRDEERRALTYKANLANASMVDKFEKLASIPEETLSKIASNPLLKDALFGQPSQA
ncbi:MAG: hypothetical protein KAR39_13400 [Thermoplasmata archaeon]|nr:hypothetical protein [Thermoplasmata archaeon]